MKGWYVAMALAEVLGLIAVIFYGGIVDDYGPGYFLIRPQVLGGLLGCATWVPFLVVLLLRAEDAADARSGQPE